MTPTPSGSSEARKSFRARQSRELARRVLALETGVLAEHVIGVSLPGQVADLRGFGQFALEMRLGRGVVARAERYLAQEAVRPGQALVVPERLAQLEGPPGQPHRPGVITLEAGQRAGLHHGGGQDRGGTRALLRVVRGQQPVELQHALGERPAPLPEQAERGGQA